jgi:hypothetical protein
MGISACIVALLLVLVGSLVDFAEHGGRLTIFIRNGGGEPNSNVTTGDQAVHSAPREEIVAAEQARLQQEVAPVDSTKSPTDSPPMRDWHLIAGEAARASVVATFRQEESRTAMWQQSHSIMFQPGSDIVVREEEPILSDFRFKPRVYVVGLGVTIGSCFIGIPLAGVPVEQRTVAISLFVCARNTG